LEDYLSWIGVNHLDRHVSLQHTLHKFVSKGWPCKQFVIWAFFFNNCIQNIVLENFCWTVDALTCMSSYSRCMCMSSQMREEKKKKEQDFK
jgi:hypothetical protein